MPLKQQLMEDMKTAMKAHDSTALQTIRFALSELKNAEIDHGELDDEAAMRLLAKQAKQMEEANQQFLQAGRQDLIDENNLKIGVLRRYLPLMMSESELTAVVRQVIADNPGQGIGPTIGLVRTRVAGTADGGAIAAEVKRQLSE